MNEADLPRVSPATRAVERVLLVFSDAAARRRVTRLLEQSRYSVRQVSALAEAINVQAHVDLVLTVAALPFEGVEASILASVLGNRQPLLLVDPAGSAGVAPQGAQVFRGEPLSDAASFLEAVDAHKRRLASSSRESAPMADFAQLLGESEAMQRVRAIANQVCSRSLRGVSPTILITGETGTGKGLIAKCLHYHGGRGHQPFVDVNCAAVPPSLVESELFGNERGAYTDARDARPGLVEAAHGGTLFLDEVATLPLGVQAKLLTAIEDKRVRRIGSRRPLQVDVQFMVATHCQLRDMVRAGEFRADLYHRLNVVSIHLPPLRERGEDALLLAETFLSELCAEYGVAPRQFSEAARRYVLSCPWPGNVRELRNRIERTLTLEDSHVIEDWHLKNDGPPSLRVISDGSELRVRLPPSGVRLDTLEREVIRETLAFAEGNISRAARHLGITRQALMYRMRKYNIVHEKS